MTTKETIAELRKMSADICEYYCDSRHLPMPECETCRHREAFAVAEKAMQKELPKKVEHIQLRKFEMGSDYRCPQCGADLIKVEFCLHGRKQGECVSYCWHCGNALDWSDSNV